MKISSDVGAVHSFTHAYTHSVYTHGFNFLACVHKSTLFFIVGVDYWITLLIFQLLLTAYVKNVFVSSFIGEMAFKIFWMFSWRLLTKHLDGSARNLTKCLDINEKSAIAHAAFWDLENFSGLLSLTEGRSLFLFLVVDRLRLIVVESWPTLGLCLSTAWT